VLERCERKTLLSWRLVEPPNTVSSYTLEYNRNPALTSHLRNRHCWGSEGTGAQLFTYGGVSFMPFKNKACHPMMSPQQATTMALFASDYNRLIGGNER